jgi:hypothetical protein
VKRDSLRLMGVTWGEDGRSVRLYRRRAVWDGGICWGRSKVNIIQYSAGLWNTSIGYTAIFSDAVLQA